MAPVVNSKHMPVPNCAPNRSFTRELPAHGGQHPVQRRKFLWIAQTALIAVYTVTITFYLPEFWLHPFGPLIKNLPILAAILVLYELEKQ